VTNTGIRQRLAAILAADVAGYSRLMAADERATVAALDSARAVFRTQIESNQGRVIDMAGDSVLAVFETATGAVSAALAVQQELSASSSAEPEERRMRFRIGVHLGDIIEKSDGTVYGDGVNIAARLEGLAEPGGITISDAVQGAVRGRVTANFVDQSEQQVKNIPHPVRAFAVRTDNRASGKPYPAAGEIDLSLPDKPSIAVLPFTNMSGDPEQEYFTDGITEDIITELSRFHSLFVIARNSSFSYKGKSPDVRQVGKELGVRYVLEGSIRRAGNRIRVTAQLIDALSGNHVWAERYDRVLEDIFAVQEEVTRSIVAVIAPQIADAEIAEARRMRPGNLSAYEIAVRASANAIEAYGRTDRALRDQAIREAKEALAKDAGSLLALSVLASSQWQHVFFRTAADLNAAWQEGMAAAIRAISLDRSDHRAYIWKGMLLLYPAIGEPRWDDALANLRRANEINPNDATALFCLGGGEAFSGNPHQGIEYLIRWLRLSPHDPRTFSVHSMLGMACFLAQNYQEALQWASLTNREAPDLPLTYLYFALAYVGLAEIDQAKAALVRARRIAPEFIQGRLGGFVPYRKAEDRERFSVFLRIAAGLEEPSAADALR
jgi:adenylate cyclase